jgi:hypothetical protein
MWPISTRVNNDPSIVERIQLAVARVVGPGEHGLKDAISSALLGLPPNLRDTLTVLVASHGSFLRYFSPRRASGTVGRVSRHGQKEI